MKRIKLAVLVGMFIATAGFFMSCGRSAPSPATPVPTGMLREITSPAGPHSGEANLAVGPAGEIYLSWIETTDSGRSALKFAMSNGENWSPSQTITAGEHLFVNRADFPSLLVLNDGVIVAHWAYEIPHAEDGYNVNLAFSRDGGKTWSKPITPHRDHTPTEHGFVSMVPISNGGVGVIWLDSRRLAENASASADFDDVALMYTSIAPDGALGPETVIDGRVCECCQPSAVGTARGSLVAYRDRTDQEIRDISVVGFDGSKWSQPKNVFADGWKINGCPINGPAIASRENHFAVAWFTAANDKPTVRIAFSADGGNTFTAPVQVDDGNPSGHVSIEVLDSGSAIVSWVDRGEQGVKVRARQIDPDGTRHPSLEIGTTDPESFPRSRLSGDSVFFSWTDPTKDQVLISALDLKK
jgi:hypothetical protein